MSVKIYDKKQKKWIIFPGTIGAPGKDAYLIAQENGYTGTKEEYAKVLTDIPKIINSIEEKPTEGSKNLITSGGVWQAIDDVHTTIDNQINIISDKVDINTENISNIEQDITNIRTTEILDQIKSSIVDNLESLAADKSLSANQGRILKEMIANLANLQIEVVDQLPSVGETNIIYLVKKSGSAPDIHDEYVFVDGKWEKIGNTEIDLSNYYTRAEVDAKIPVIPNIETSISGAGNVITLIEVDANNKHKVNATKGISVYTKQEVDDMLTGSGLGDVIAAEAFTTADRVITSNGPGKTVKDSGILIGNLALKSYVDEKEIAWDKVTGKPETYVPAAHTHPLAQITDAGALASKSKVDKSDLNFDIPEGIVVDSSLSTTSVNPVQNKIVTEALNNRYTKSETYSQSEIDEKIGSAGGGDVIASGNFVADYIIVGAGTKSIKNSGQTLSNLALKSEIPSLNGYATQSWVNSQGFITEAGDNYYPTTFTWTNGTTAGPTGSLTGVGMSAVSFNAIPVASTTQSGVVTTGDQSFAGEKTFMGGISAQDADISDLIIGSSLEFNAFGRFNYIATSTEAGGIKIGATASGVNLPLVLNRSNQAYIAVTKGAVTAALGFTPANVNDIPEIPITLPNPYALNVTAGGSTTSYTGSLASTIDLDNIYAKKLPSVDTPGKPGLYFASSGSVNVTEVYVTENNPDAIILVANTVDVTFGENYHKMDGIDSLSGGNYKCYCITYVRGVVLVNGAIYG